MLALASLVLSVNCGMIVAARMAMITTTISTSTSVKAERRSLRLHGWLPRNELVTSADSLAGQPQSGQIDRQCGIALSSGAERSRQLAAANLRRQADSRHRLRIRVTRRSVRKIRACRKSSLVADDCQLLDRRTVG